LSKNKKQENGMAKIAIKKIFPNPEQPRKNFDAVELETLAESIQQHGLINPISVEGPLEGDVYILIDGERRWRAAGIAGLAEIEASVRPAMNGQGPRDRLLMAVAANIQRTDMNPLEEAQAYKKMREFGISVDEIAVMVGRSNSSVNTKLGLTDFPAEVQKLFAQNKLPISSQVNAALRSLPEGRVVFVANNLAAKNATIKTIMMVCKRIANAEAEGADRRIERGKNPMAAVAEKYEATANGHWNMVSQAKTFNLNPKVREAAVKVCTDCALYEDASERVCKDCPAVTLLRLLAK
jgi:ParB family transcriptional regulator, chromosome partitioning protein